MTFTIRLDREHHKVFRQAFFQKGLPPEAYRKLKLMTLPGELHPRQHAARRLVEGRKNVERGEDYRLRYSRTELGAAACRRNCLQAHACRP